MSSEAVGWHLPAVVTLDDLTAMMGSEGIDTVTKRIEYAAAGIPQYWIVGQDSAQTVTVHRLRDDHYTVQATMPLAWVLNTNPAEYDLG